MRKSTIAKHLILGPDAQLSRAIGTEIRLRREAMGLSQAACGEPLTRAYVSQVEHGRVTPSLASLLIIAERLNTSAATILETAEERLRSGPDHAHQIEAHLARRS